MTRLFRFARLTPARLSAVARSVVALSLGSVVLTASPVAALAQTATPDGPGGTAAPGGAPSDLCTDRPTKVYATCTVDAGHFQVETDLFNGAFQRQGGVTTDTWYATNPTLKYGVSSKLDVEANIVPYEIVRTHDKSGDGSTVGGVGDLYLRAKYAAYSSPDGKLSLSVIPYVKAPIARDGIGNGEVEGGSVLAVGYKLTDKLSLALSPELDAYADDVGSGRHLNHVEVINLGYDLPHGFTVSGELWGDWNYDPSGTIRQYSADVALAWDMTKTVQFDGGLNFGLNRQTPGVQAYVGVSQKF